MNVLLNLMTTYFLYKYNVNYDHVKNRDERNMKTLNNTIVNITLDLTTLTSYTSTIEIENIVTLVTENTKMKKVK